MVEAGPVELGGPGGRLPAYEARPAGKAPVRGAVVVLSEVYGLNEYLEDVTRRFAGEGYHAVAPDIFHRHGGGPMPYDAGAEVGERLAGLHDDDIVADCDAVLGHFASQGWQAPQVGAVGFRLGGRVSFLLAVERSLGAAVGFSGGGIVQPRVPHLPALIERAPLLQAPWLGLYGDGDVWTSTADLERLRGELSRSSHVQHEVVVYEGVGHGFHCDRDSAAHQPDAARRAWHRALEWLDEHLAPTPQPPVR